MSRISSVRVAVTQHEPAWLDLKAGVNKTCQLIEEAAQGGAQLVTFPEVWIPGYPWWIWARPVDFELGTNYVKNSLAIDSDEMRTICDSAKQNKIVVSLGFSENDADSLYIAQVLIDETGTIRMKRRKMKPTHMERTIFGDASGDCLSDVVATKSAGRLGSLNCWEHIQPLLKYYIMAQKEQIHIAAWPGPGPFIQGGPGLWSMSAEGIRNLSQTYAVEGQAYVLHCTSVFGEAGVKLMGTAGHPQVGSPAKGTSAIFGPDGRLLDTGDTPDEKLIIADLDMNEVVRLKTFADASGHYSRPDLLWLGADSTKRTLVKPNKASEPSALRVPDDGPAPMEVDRIA